MTSFQRSLECHPTLATKYRRRTLFMLSSRFIKFIFTLFMLSSRFITIIFVLFMLRPVQGVFLCIKKCRYKYLGFWFYFFFHAYISPIEEFSKFWVFIMTNLQGPLPTLKLHNIILIEISCKKNWNILFILMNQITKVGRTTVLYEERFLLDFRRGSFDLSK